MKSLHLATALLIGTTAFSATVSAAGLGAFEKIDTPASFIHGDNLVNGAPYALPVGTSSLPVGTSALPVGTSALPVGTSALPVGTSALPVGSELDSVAARAAAISAVAVSADGTQYRQTIDVEAYRVLEQAIADLEALGLDSTIFSRPSVDLPELLRRDGGNAEPSVVIGTDSRTQVTNTTANPWYKIGRIAIGCTGTLVGTKYVLTAGHCVADGKGNWYSSLNFTAAQNGSSKPYGTTSWSNAVTTSAWFNSGNSNYDYALIILASAPHGAYASYGAYSGGTHRITGYPGDKPTGTMWTATGSTTSTTYMINYSIDTAGGQSGSGIMDSSYVVRGIHTLGSSSGNSGVKITSSVASTISGWIASY